MLFAVALAPLLTALLFHFGLPAAENALCTWFGKEAILATYYLLFDLILCFMAPFMFSMAAAFVMLDEYDDAIASYLAVTPVGKRGYIFSRLWMPVFLAFLVSLILMRFFSLTEWRWVLLLPVCALTAAMSVLLSLLLFSFSKNRVEGMAMAKLSGLLMLGLAVPFFWESNTIYLFSPLPTLWIGMFATQGGISFAAAALVLSCIWLAVLYRRFERKLS